MNGLGVGRDLVSLSCCAGVATLMPRRCDGAARQLRRTARPTGRRTQGEVRERACRKSPAASTASSATSIRRSHVGRSHRPSRARRRFRPRPRSSWRSSTSCSSRRRKGKIHLDETLTLDRAQAVGGTGVLVEMGTPTLSIRDYAVLMVTLSDNTATNVLIDRLGMDEIAARMQASA